MEPLTPATPSGASPHVASLLKSFSVVPSAAVPAIIDCVLASSAISLPDLFFSLLQTFPTSTEDIPSSYVLSHANAICHLIKSAGARDDLLTRFIWRVLFPLLKAIDPSDVELANQIIGLLCKLSFETHAWECLGAELVPFCLKTIGISVGILRSEPSAVYQWSNDDETVGSLPFPIACRLLTSLLDTSLKRRREIQSLEQDLSVSLNQFSHSLTWDLSKMVLGGLLQSSEHRTFTIHLLLPTIVFSLGELSPVTVILDGSQYTNSWVCFSKELWTCCVALLSLGHVERLDAYSALSSYFSACNQYEGPCSVTTNENEIADRFSMITMKEFWETIQYGLVDKDGSVRKQALYILKIVLNCCSCCKPNHNLRLSNESVDILASTMISSNSDSSTYGSLTKREKWAYKEAKSLGVGEVCHIGEDALHSHERWKIFVLLYEMLEEYGTHLVEAAWTHQVSLMFQSGSISSSNPIPGEIFEVQMENLDTIFSWLSVLWERGFCHENPQVRCLIMDSFLSIDWNQCGYCAHKVPRSFVLGPLVRALNDVAHHKDFGVKGVYTSRTIERASKFFGEFSRELVLSDRISIVWSLASATASDSFGRAGLMALACCLGTAASESYAYSESKDLCSAQGTLLPCSIPDLLDALGIVVERSKQHFNPKYRLKVCQQVIKAASSLIRITEIPVDLLLHFLSTIPREFTELSGPLREIVQSWLIPSGDGHSIEAKLHVLKHLTTFPLNFITHTQSFEASVSYDDDDVDSWGAEAQRWARVLLLVIKGEEQLDEIFMFFEKYSNCLCKHDSKMDWAPIKFLILVLNLVEEIQNGRRRVTCSIASSSGQDLSTKLTVDTVCPLLTTICEKSVRFFVHVLDKFLAFAKLVSPILWSMDAVKNMPLPASIKGKLGGPSQRRLASPITASVLQAILSIRTVASISSWSNELAMNESLDSPFNFLWNFVWEAIQSPTYSSETGAEIRLAVYEALASVLKVFASSFSDLHLKISALHSKLQFSNGEEKPLLDHLSLSFLTNINELLANGLLTRSRRAVLMNWKWICVDALLSVPFNRGCQSGQLANSFSFFSSSTLKKIASDIIDSLENAGENSMLPLLRSVRLVFGLLFFNRTSPIMLLLDGAADQMMWQLVESSWILHLSCNKRRVAPIAALLSAVLHKSAFGDISMHEMNNSKPGPLKWFIQKLLDDGQKSPRTIRLAALHLTGLWLLYPETIKYYIKELKFLSLYGSVAFDEDFEAELSENYEARIEVSLLAQSPDHEFTEVFINTEMYARASVATLFFKLATDEEVLGKHKSLAAVEGGKMFLLELLDSVVNEKDLAKELYKKYSGVHRRKVRAWQMICILSPFVEEDIVEIVTSKLHTSLCRNNLPAVRQYLENFAIQIYLKFPLLAEKQLIPIFCDYSMRQQALSSYVFISAKVILHESDLAVRSRHLDELLPPIIPFLTSHHHSLRGFTQLLVYHVLCKLWPLMGLNGSEVSSLEKRCFKELKSYLTENTDCLRLRSSMEGFLDSFDPCASATPAGVFNVHKEGSEFECVPISLMDQVTNFLNDVRDDLRSSTAKDAMTIKNECLQASSASNYMKETPENNSGRESLVMFSDASLDFQKKITLNKHLKPPLDVDTPFGNFEIPEVISEFEKEDQLFTSVLQARNQAVEKIRGSHQQFILVASLIDRIPNLAGLARTCEVFKAAGLAIADANILHDKQFQLISVTADKWVPIMEVPVNNMKAFLEKKRQEGFSILGLEQTANSTPLDHYSFPTKTVLVLGREKEGIPVDIIHTLDACVEIPQMGVIRSLNVHVSGAIALWEYTRQQRCKQ